MKPEVCRYILNISLWSVGESSVVHHKGILTVRQRHTEKDAKTVAQTNTQT